MTTFLATKSQNFGSDISDCIIHGVVRVQCAEGSLEAQLWHMHPIGFDPLPRRTSVLLTPNDLGLRTIAVADLDVLRGNPHVGLPRPAHHGHGDVGLLSTVDEDLIRVVVHTEADPVATVLEHLVDLLREAAGEALECTSIGGVIRGQHVGHHPAQYVGFVIGTVVVLGVLEDSCPPHSSSSAGGGGGLEGLFHEDEVHDYSLGSWIVPVQVILKITQNYIISWPCIFVNSMKFEEYNKYYRERSWVKRDSNFHNRLEITGGIYVEI